MVHIIDDNGKKQNPEKPNIKAPGSSETNNLETLLKEIVKELHSINTTLKRIDMSNWKDY